MPLNDVKSAEISSLTYWRLIRELTLAQMKARYRRTFAGFIWVILSPIIMFGVQALVFKHFLKINLPNYGLFLFGGLLPWIFIINSLEMGVPSLFNAKNLLTAFRVEPFVILGGSILDNWINFLAAFFVVLVPALIVTREITIGLLFLPLAMLVLLAGVAGLAAFLAVLNIFYRDVRFLVHFILGLLSYLTPIFYPREFVSSQFAWIVELNPLFHLVEGVRACVYEFAPDRVLFSLLKALCVATIFIFLAVVYWNRRKNEFYHYL